MSELQIDPPMLIKRLRPKTYSIAIYIVALFILLEVLALGFVFYFRKQAVEIENVEAALAEEIAIPSSSPVELVASGDSVVAPSDAKSRLSIAEAEPTEEKIMKLNEEARLFRNDGDFTLAEAALKNALALDPEYPATLANLAMLEEARKDNEKARSYWMKIIDMKDNEKAVGVLALAKERAALIEERNRLESETLAREKQLFETTNVLAIKAVRTIPDPLPEEPSYIAREFDLAFVGKELDPAKVKVQVLYYEKDQAGELVTGQISASFVSKYPDWKGKGVETLTTKWSSSSGKSYYGYVMRLYYDGKVQDERAEPRSLLEKAK
ncbi:MAG: hypothetical protein AAGA18_04925 [Verrucomicrobiota bacterium]